MTDPMDKQSPLAVLADIHGNPLALEAVLADARQRGVSRFVNLGDTFYGPLFPAETWSILKLLGMPTILGNQDRILLEGGPDWEGVPAFRAARRALGEEGLAWLRALPATSVLDDDILLCHGTPTDDMAYLLEDIVAGRPVLRDCAAIEADILPEASGCSLVLAGHSHRPGHIRCGDVTIVNPGSVGLPAYDDDSPPHAMASGSPHAKYALVWRAEAGWEVEFRNVEYDWETVAAKAQENGREDWAGWLRTGLA